MPDTTALPNAFAVQADDYAHRLPGRLTELSLLWDLARSGDAAALNALHHQAHQLRGSAGLYGFTRLGDAACALDIALADARVDGPDALLTDARAESLDGLVAAVTAASHPAGTTPASGASLDAGLAAPSTENRDDAVVLIVDDDPAIRDVLCLYLEREGFLVVTAADGAEGLACVRRHRPDVVLLDLAMPGVDGAEALRAIRTDPDLATTPVVILTASDETDTVLRVLRYEVDGYLTKPAEVSGVVSKVFGVLMASA
jgi:CheY-like chemotaxis protein